MTQIKAIVPVQVPTANSVAPRCKQRRLGKEDYDSLSHAELVTALVARDAELLDARSGKRKSSHFLQQQVRRVRQQQDLQCCNINTEFTLMTVPEHKHRSHLKKSQMLAIGLRRNMSNISSCTYGLITATDVSRQSVCRAEVFAGWQLKDSFRWWMFDRMASTTSHGDKQCLMVVSYSADATNSSIWQRRKLQSMLVEVRSCIDSRQESLRAAADLLPVEDGSAKGAEALLWKQLRGLGIPLWSDIHNSDCNHARSLWLYISTSDCGPDQALCRKTIAARIRPMRRVAFMSMICLLSPRPTHCQQWVGDPR